MPTQPNNDSHVSGVSPFQSAEDIQVSFNGKGQEKPLINVSHTCDMRFYENDDEWFPFTANGLRFIILYVQLKRGQQSNVEQ